MVARVPDWRGWMLGVLLSTTGALLLLLYQHHATTYRDLLDVMSADLRLLKESQQRLELDMLAVRNQTAQLRRDIDWVMRPKHGAEHSHGNDGP